MDDNQHFVQAAYIGLFSSDKNETKLREKHIYVTYKKENKTIYQKAEKIAKMNHYMSFKDDKGKYNKYFENELSTIEKNFDAIKDLNNNIKKLKNGKKAYLPDERKKQISEYIAMTFLRTLYVRTVCLATLNKSNKLECNIVNGEKTISKYNIKLVGLDVNTRDDKAKLFHIDIFYIEYQNIINFLENSIIIFQKTYSKNKFITSDNPMLKFGKNSVDNNNNINNIEHFAFPLSPFCYINFFNSHSLNPNISKFDKYNHLDIYDVKKNVVDFFNSEQRKECLNATYSYDKN